MLYLLFGLVGSSTMLYLIALAIITAGKGCEARTSGENPEWEILCLYGAQTVCFCLLVIPVLTLGAIGDLTSVHSIMHLVGSQWFWACELVLSAACHNNVSSFLYINNISGTSDVVV